MTVGQDFFTVDSLTTMAVSSAAIIAVTNTIRKAYPAVPGMSIWCIVASRPATRGGRGGAQWQGHDL
jgi:hypothetical protein